MVNFGGGPILRMMINRFFTKSFKRNSRIRKWTYCAIKGHFSEVYPLPYGPYIYGRYLSNRFNALIPEMAIGRIYYH